MVGIFSPWKSVNAKNENFFFFFLKCQYTSTPHWVSLFVCLCLGLCISQSLSLCICVFFFYFSPSLSSDKEHSYFQCGPLTALGQADARPCAPSLYPTSLHPLYMVVLRGPGPAPGSGTQQAWEYKALRADPAACDHSIRPVRALPQPTEPSASFSEADSF